MQYPGLFAIILNWNFKEDTIECINSLLKGSYVPEEIIVVDNGSCDGSPEALSKCFGDRIKLLINERNLGFAGGMNVGIRYAINKGAQWILLLNNDVIVAKDMVEELLKVAESDKGKKFGILAPIIFHYDKPEKLWKLGDIDGHILPLSVKLGYGYLKRGKDIIPVDYVTGCGMLVRREVFSTVGLFDERYFMYYEDADLCKRAARNGFSIACVITARMWHKVSRSAGKNTRQQRYLKARYRVLFYRTHYHFLSWLYLILSALLTVLKDMAKGNFQEALAYIKGFWHGWKEV